MNRRALTSRTLVLTLLPVVLIACSYQQSNNPESDSSQPKEIASYKIENQVQQIYQAGSDISQQVTEKNPSSHQPLAEAVIDAAIDSSTRDPRFPSVDSAELGDLIVEVTALTPPIEVKASSAQERLDSITIGIDGIIIQDNCTIQDTHYIGGGDSLIIAQLKPAAGRACFFYDKFVECFIITNGT